MKIYCQSCGTPTSYGSKKPSFCQNCGKSLASRTKENKFQQAIIEDEEHEVSEVPNINKLEVEIESPKVHGVKIGDAFGCSPRPEGYEEEAEGPPLPKVDAIQALKDEGGALKP